MSSSIESPYLLRVMIVKGLIRGGKAMDIRKLTKLKKSISGWRTYFAFLTSAVAGYRDLTSKDNALIAFPLEPLGC